MNHRWASPVRAAIVLAGVLAIVVAAGVAPGASAKGKPSPKGEDSNGHVQFGIGLRMLGGVKYTIATTHEQCVENVQTIDDTTSRTDEYRTLGFDPTNGLFDGCLTNTSYVYYEMKVTAPWTGKIAFSYGNGVVGGAYSVRCLRWSLEAGLWCHKTAQGELFIGKLN
jgi:hypothetical protein